MDYVINLTDKGVSFIGIFGLVFAILYIIKVIYNVMKVYTLREGQVQLGKNGLLYLSCAISYIFAYILK